MSLTTLVIFQGNNTSTLIINRDLDLRQLYYKINHTIVISNPLKYTNFSTGYLDKYVTIRYNVITCITDVFFFFNIINQH